MSMSDEELISQIARLKGSEFWESPSVLPDWTHSIAAAWELVEEMCANQSNQVTFVVNHDYIICDYWDWKGALISFSEAPTMPRAICEAYLPYKKLHIGE